MHRSGKLCGPQSMAQLDHVVQAVARCVSDHPRAALTMGFCMLVDVNVPILLLQHLKDHYSTEIPKDSQTCLNIFQLT